MKFTANPMCVRPHFLIAGIFLATALLVSPEQSVAQSTSASVMLEEVTVTARRREENLQDMPLSISAFTDEQMLVQGVYTIDDVSQFVPNVTLTSHGRANNNRVVIRGIGGGFPDPVFAFGSGMYIDGHYIPNSTGGYMSTVDVERIELLRGPQGTLFGKNVTGGAVNIISTRPQPEFDSSVLVRATDDGQRDIRGMLNIPFSDTVYGRFSVAREEYDGYYFNQNLGIDSGFTENTSGRAAIRIAPNDEWTVDLVGHVSRQRDDNNGGQCIGYGEKNDAPQWGGGAGNLERRLYTGAEADFVALCEADMAAGDFINSSDKFTFSNVDEEGAQLGIAWDSDSAGNWDRMGVRAKAAYRSFEYTYFADRDYVSWPVDGIGSAGKGTNSDTYSAELIFEADVNESFRFTVGANWFKEDIFTGADNCRNQFIASGAETNPNVAVECTPQDGLFFELVPNASGTGLWPNGPRLNAGGPGPFFQNVSVWNESIGVFGNATWDISDRWRMDFGIRYTQDDREFTNIEFPVVGCDVSVDPNNRCDFRPIMSQATVIGDGFYNAAQDTFDATTPMISLTYNLEPTDNMPNGMFYALYSEGFLTGGFNTEVNSNLPAIAPFLSFEPEQVNNYEVGFKGRLAGGNLSIMASLFYMDYKDQQQSVDIANPDGRFGADDPVSLVQNVASSAIYGLELELRAAPWEGGFMSLDVGYLKNEFDEYNYASPTVPGLIVDLSDALINDYTPDWTVNFAVDHQFEMSSGATLTPRANVYYQTNYDFGAVNGWFASDPSSSCNQESYATLDARLTFVPAEGDWQLSAYGGNITDERYLEFCDTQRSVWRTRLGRPRHWGLEFLVHFGRN